MEKEYSCKVDASSKETLLKTGWREKALWIMKTDKNTRENGRKTKNKGKDSISGPTETSMRGSIEQTKDRVLV